MLLSKNKFYLKQFKDICLIYIGNIPEKDSVKFYYYYTRRLNRILYKVKIEKRILTANKKFIRKKRFDKNYKKGKTPFFRWLASTKIKYLISIIMINIY
jgi:hypothetical protein